MRSEKPSPAPSEEPRGEEAAKPTPAAPKRESPSRRKPDPRPIDWETISDEELLRMRICDLPLKIDDFLRERIEAVYAELDAKGIAFHPECYLGDEWFSPEGDPVVSIPYYLAQRRLVRLEKSWALEAEGESREEFLQLLRHELGHALSHAYKLHKTKGYSKVFGPSSQEYPDSYRPRPYSRRYVVHLENWYAQSHPDEDFAETFAVWLTPGIDWRKDYAGWGALAKLEFVDRMMTRICGKKPARRRGEKFRRLSTIRMTVAQSHKIKRRALESDFPEYFDRDLKTIFAPTDRGERAAKFLRRHRTMLVRCVSQWTGEKRYTIQGLVTRFAERCVELNLRVQRSEAETLARATACLTTMATNYFLTGKFKRHL
ncbi:MAG: hypothetical protein COV48_16105 [Elusimicrobia bacterium CG11_big_fil_rev_8_21_14_0_20_64_6]|nr:MAG: hypothetical protein COV48_16105 [Elusimicrobia bacterium CG11_big_fil_rev_8_21_14_0_20_64_6]